MQITYELTEKDFVEAYSTHCSHGPSSKWRRAILFWCLVLVLGAFIFYIIATHGAYDFTSYLPLLALAIIWFVIIRWLQRSSVKRQFRNQPGAHGQRSLLVDDSGAHWRWDGGSADVEWKNYIRYVEGENQILFYTSPAGFNILPTRELQSAQLAELRELLKQLIPTK